MGHALWEGGKAIVKTVANTVRSVATGLLEGAKNVVSGVFSLLGSLFG
jgi:phage-related protein